MTQGGAWSIVYRHSSPLRGWFLDKSKYINAYGWTQNSRQLLLVKPSTSGTSFVFAHNQLRVDGIMGTKNTFNQMKYRKALCPVLPLSSPLMKLEKCRSSTKFDMRVSPYWIDKSRALKLFKQSKMEYFRCSHIKSNKINCRLVGSEM